MHDVKQQTKKKRKEEEKQTSTYWTGTCTCMHEERVDGGGGLGKIEMQ